MPPRAPRLDVIKPSPSVAAYTRAKELQAQGVDIISLGVGEPDFDTPEHIVDAAIAAMRRGETKYTAADGTAELKAAIARKFARENGLAYSADEISVANGAKQIIFNALMASLAPGDEVLIPVPAWVSYIDMVLMAEGRPLTLQCPASDRFKLRPEALEAAITDRTRWLMLNSPSNPTGAIYSADELRGLGEVLSRHPQVMVMTDDIYEHIRFQNAPFATFAQVCPDLRDRVLTVNGVSKAYAMTGWRIGYAGGPSGLIKGMAVIQTQTTTNPCSISQAAAVAALDGPQDFLTERAAAFKARRDRTFDRIQTIDGLSCDIRPPGAFYLYPGCGDLLGRKTPGGKVIGTDDDLVMYLLDEALVSTVQGSAYGLSPHLRLSIATSVDLLDKAMDRIEAALARLS